MAQIPNFPQAMLSKHAKWHMDHMNEGAPGEGVAFLEFHHKFIAEFHAWYDTQSFAKPRAVAPWKSLPKKVVANLSQSDANKLAAIAANPGNFATEDALGI